MHDKKIQNVLSLPVKDRYGYFVRKVADFEKIWLTKNDKSQIQTIFIKDKIESIPVWPEKEFAELTLDGPRKNLRAEAMDLYEFLDWLISLEQEGYKIAVFPLPDLTSIMTDPSILKEHIETECEEYE